METIAPSKRRWLRLSLRSFFVLITVVSMFLGWKSNAAVQQREAVESIRKSGGGFTYDYQHGTANLAELPGPPWLRNWIGIDFFIDVIEVDCRDTSFDDIDAVGKLRQLQRLNLNNTQVKDLSPLANLTKLGIFECRETAVSDVKGLRWCRQLRFVQLNNTGVSDLTPLAKASRLEELYLQNTLVQDVSPLAALEELEFLGLRGTRVSDVSPLQKLTKLKWIDLRDTPAKRGDLQTLQRLLPKCNVEFNQVD